MYKFIILTLYLSYSHSKSALEYFLKNKDVKSVTITNLDTTNNTSAKWIEYTYYFNVINKDIQPSSKLKIGFESQHKYKEKRAVRKAKLEEYFFNTVELLQEIIPIR